MDTLRGPSSSEDPNEKILLFIETSRQVIAGAPRKYIVLDTFAKLDRLATLIADMRSVPNTRPVLAALASQITPLLKTTARQMDEVRQLLPAR